MSPEETLTTETQLPFAVDQAVLDQVAEFLQQQALGPGTAKPPPVPAQIDF